MYIGVRWEDIQLGSDWLVEQYCIVLEDRYISFVQHLTPPPTATFLDLK